MMPLSAKLIVQTGPKAGQEFSLDQPELVIGREAGSDVILETPMVSRRHARFFRRGDEILVEDLGSRNGTIVNGQRLEAPQVLKNGDRIELGPDVRLSFVSAPPPVETVEQIAPTVAQAAPTVRAPDLDPGATMLGMEPLPPELSQPPSFELTSAGMAIQNYPLLKPRLTLGRAPDNDIVINSPIVSGHHAVLEKSLSGYNIHALPNITNPLYFNGQPVAAPVALHDGDLLRIGGSDPGLLVSLAYKSPAEAAAKKLTQGISFQGKERLAIGRHPSNDIVLDTPSVSRYHAVVERVGQRFRARDLDSGNGTFINNQRISGETWINPGDEIRIGMVRFVLGADNLTEFDESSGLHVEAVGLNKWVRKDLNLLKDLSLVFKPREFIVIVGQSGGGKSTLVDAIAGYRPSTHGSVHVNGVDAYQHFDVIRNQIGFVPQKDIIHMELSVLQELDYAARLRMPSDTDAAERAARVGQVLDDLDLTHRKEVQISGLSGGQQKRVSIGVELLTKPGLFFLDEPTSGLDPGTETALMHLMRRLADQGRTIILITHATKNVMLADKVVFLARGGFLAWFGPPDEALAYFDQFRSEQDRRSKPMEFDEIYATLDDASKGKAEDWHQRYLGSPAYQRYIVDPLRKMGYTLPAAGAAKAQVVAPPSQQSPATVFPRKNQVSALRQFRILSSRNFKILTRDRISLVLMLAAAPLIGLLDIALASAMGRNLYDYNEGTAANVITATFMPLMYGILIGALSQMREFVKEKDIYKRERLVNLKVLPYVFSKVGMAILMAIYQAACYTLIHHLGYDMPGGSLAIGLYFVSMFLLVLSGMMLGLFGSALAPNANAAPLLVILMVTPMLVMSGALIPLPNAVTSATTTRWAFEGLIGTSGFGSDLAKDACWALPEEIRSELTLDDKRNLNCNCMGLNALKQDNCDFPGLGQFYDPSVDAAEPLEPQPLGNPPPEPVVPPAPEPPADQSDQVAMADFFQKMQEYQAEVEEIQNEYKRQIADYQARSEVFKAEATTYQQARAEWEIQRAAAVGKAEGLMNNFNKDFRWTFVNKDDDSAYWSKLINTWVAQLIFQGVFLGLILVIMARKK